MSSKSKDRASDAVDHHDVSSLMKKEENDEKNDDDEVYGVMPSPHTLKDEWSRCRFIHETSRGPSWDEEKK